MMLETENPVEAQRCRRAQYTNYAKEVTINGSKIFGIVLSVREEPGPLWIVTVVPTEAKVFKLPAYRPAHL
jgi:hypothetical protein